MTDIAIRVENLGKKYHIGSGPRHDTLRDAIMGRFRRDGRSAEDETIWALKDVSFDVRHGEVLGIIGRNGAGKSTLLKILCRITEPTTGRAEINGRVGSLLEVGTGFHPELTGRENVYLSGAILGMTRAEIDRKFDEIVAFSGVEKFLDTPFKRYSSGMRVRLGFAVAAHLDPEVLLIDEVLAVGDAQFQKKCLGKMGEVSREGRTVLFVSHNMTAIKSLCPQAMLLSEGVLARMGPVEEVVDHYLSFAWQPNLSQTWDSIDSAPSNGDVAIRHLSVAPRSGHASDQITVETPLRVTCRLSTFKEMTLNLSMHVQRISGETVFAAPSPKVAIAPGMATFACDIPGHFMNDGLYTIHMMVVRESKPILVLDDRVMFEVHDVARDGSWLGKWPGAVRPKLNWDYSTNPIRRNGERLR